MEQALTSFFGVDWQLLLLAIHYVSATWLLAAAPFVDFVSSRALVAGGPAPRRRHLNFILSTTIASALLLVLSSSVLAITQFTYDAVERGVVIKLVAAAIYFANALLADRTLIPLVARRGRNQRPSAGLTDTLKCSSIVATSICCWSILAAVSLFDNLQRMSTESQLTAILAAWITVFALLTAATSFGQLHRRKESTGTQQSKLGQRDPHQLVTARSSEPPDNKPKQTTTTHRLQTLLNWKDGLLDSLGQSPSNDNDRKQVRERLEQARMNSVRRERRVTANEALAREADTHSNQRGNGKVSREPQADEQDQEISSVVQITDISRACRRALLGVGIISFFSNMLMLTGPLFMLQVYDRVLTSKSVPTLAALLLLVVGLFVFMAVLDFIRVRLLVRIGLRIDRMLSPAVLERTIEVSSAADQAKRIQLRKDLHQTRQFISGAGTTAIFDMPWAPLYFGLIMMFHWSLGVVALIGAAILVTLSLLNEFLSKALVAEASIHAAGAERMGEAGRRNSETLSAMGMTETYRNRWLTEHAAELVAQTKAADISGFFSVLTKTLRLVLQSAMLAMGAYLVLGNAISPGVMIASSIILSRALAPVELAIAHWRSFIAARQGWQRLTTEFANAGTREARIRLPVPEGHVSVQNVFAAPLDVREPVLKGVNFDLRPGDGLAVIGPSGSGKSTLARVLVGVWPTLRGHVRLDGAPLEHWPSQQLGHHIGYLPQSAELFEGTIAENIARFYPSAEASAVIEAAQSANVHEMILGLSDGYNTRVGEGGTVLSGGQRQRIALARAFFGQPSLMILDEPNSNLDSDGETALAEAMRKMRDAGRTVIIMSHRRKALEHVNSILVLNDGRQVAFGPKNEVLGSVRASGKTEHRIDYASR
ncbi:MAG: type I secretion system permease/ATPase [Pseudomonadota bacterium]